MDAMELKSDLHKMIDKINDLNVLNAIKTLLNNQNIEVDFWDELPDSVIESAERGMEQARNGETKSHDEVMQKHSRWL